MASPKREKLFGLSTKEWTMINIRKALEIAGVQSQNSIGKEDKKPQLLDLLQNIARTATQERKEELTAKFVQFSVHRDPEPPWLGIPSSTLTRPILRELARVYDLKGLRRGTKQNILWALQQLTSEFNETQLWRFITLAKLNLEDLKEQLQVIWPPGGDEELDYLPSPTSSSYSNAEAATASVDNSENEDLEISLSSLPQKIDEEGFQLAQGETESEVLGNNEDFEQLATDHEESEIVQIDNANEIPDTEISLSGSTEEEAESEVQESDSEFKPRDPLAKLIHLISAHNLFKMLTSLKLPFDRSAPKLELEAILYDGMRQVEHIFQPKAATSTDASSGVTINNPYPTREMPELKVPEVAENITPRRSRRLLYKQVATPETCRRERSCNPSPQSIYSASPTREKTDLITGNTRPADNDIDPRPRQRPRIETSNVNDTLDTLDDTKAKQIRSGWTALNHIE